MGEARRWQGKRQTQLRLINPTPSSCDPSGSNPRDRNSCCDGWVTAFTTSVPGAAVEASWSALTMVAAIARPIPRPRHRWRTCTSLMLQTTPEEGEPVTSAHANPAMPAGRSRQATTTRRLPGNAGRRIEVGGVAAAAADMRKQDITVAGPGNFHPDWYGTPAPQPPHRRRRPQAIRHLHGPYHRTAQPRQHPGRPAFQRRQSDANRRATAPRGRRSAPPGRPR